MSETTTIRQAINNVELCGHLKKLELTLEKGTDFKGEFVIATDDMNEHTIQVYQSPLTKDKKTNTAFTGMATWKRFAEETEKALASGVKIEDLERHFKSIEALADVEPTVSVATLLKLGYSREDAWKYSTKVSLPEKWALLSKREFYTSESDDSFVSLPQIESRFFNHVKPAEFTPKESFKIEMFINGIKREYVNSEATGRLVIEGIVPLREGRLATFDFVVPVSLADQFESCYEPKRTAIFWGKIVDTVNVKKVSRGGFGAVREEEERTYVHELVIEGGTGEPYAEENKSNYTVDQIAAAMQVRETEYKPAMLAKKKNKGTTAAPARAAGFGATAAPASTTGVAENFRY